MFVIKRIYEPSHPDDGFRVLVDRLWPRGLSKEKAGVDLWLRDIAPSTPLRKWFGHEEKRWPGFVKKYEEELRQKKDLLEELRRRSAAYGKVTLLYGARDQEHNEAVVLEKVLEK
jgi:uncharacterized protein YeaO (DUF488 family)